MMNLLLTSNWSFDKHFEVFGDLDEISKSIVRMFTRIHSEYYWLCIEVELC
jgi:hypothetical protein